MLVEIYDPITQKTIYVRTHPFLYGVWKELSKKVIVKNSDRVYTVVGMERSGKSTWVFQQAKIIDPSFGVHNICFTPEQFLETIRTASPGSVVVFDEAFRGFSSKSSQSRVNKALVQAMMEVGRRNLVIFIVLPSFNYLEHYIAVHRSRGLFQIYEKASKSYRAWKFYSRKQQPKIYGLGKKNYGIFPKIKTRHTGKFFAIKTTLPSGKVMGLPYETFDYEAYDKKKELAFNSVPIKEVRDEDWRAKCLEMRYKIVLMPYPIKSLKEVADALGVSYQTVKNWRKEGKDSGEPLEEDTVETGDSMENEEQ
jgi:hypothetical protein